MSRPVLALALKGDKFTDPIDGKVLKPALWLWNAKKQCPISNPFFKDIVYFGYF
jgi:hypothetical protein